MINIIVGILLVFATLLFSIHLTLPMVLIGLVVGALTMLSGVIKELLRR